MKEEFFVATAGTHIFKIDKFMSILKNKSFLPDSYTAFQNKIGFNISKELNNNVVLDFPYKDCYLEGGQTKEQGKRKEIFFNKILAKDQINKLLEPKVFVNAKRITKDGETPLEESPLTEFTLDEDKRDIKDNLLIKGNNLLALHSLKKRFGLFQKVRQKQQPCTCSDTMEENAFNKLLNIEMAVFQKAQLQPWLLLFRSNLSLLIWGFVDKVRDTLSSNKEISPEIPFRMWWNNINWTRLSPPDCNLTDANIYSISGCGERGGN